MLKPMCGMAVAVSLIAVSFESNALVVEPPPGGGSSSSSSSTSSSSSSSSSSITSGPDCSGAAASRGIIWPPDHKMVAETIIDVTDPDGLPVSIAITDIRQDEPVRGREGDDAQPDGSGVGTSTAYVRAERAGRGTGLIYFISFTATNSQGRQCTGTVEAFVPHHLGLTPTDTGHRYDSTATADDGRDDGRDGDRDGGRDDGRDNGRDGGRHDD